MTATKKLMTDPADLAAFFGFAFTDEQLESITAPMEPLVIMAGAGTGKTTVMEARVLWLVASGQVAPDQVLGLTFTNKAAAELGRRINAVLDRWGAAQSETGHADPDLEVGPSVSTYNAFASRLVTESGLLMGVEPDARLLTQPARFQLAMRVVTRAKGPFTFIEGSPTTIAGHVLALENEMNEQLCSADQIRAHDQAHIAELETIRDTNSAKFTKVAKDARSAAGGRLELLGLVEEFRREKQRLALMDFGDQIGFAARLAREFPEIGRDLRVRFAVVLLDEYQDTSVAQKSFLLDLFGQGHSLTAVGDPLQAIYGWRGASAGNIEIFAHEFTKADEQKANQAGLGVNNRSGQLILDVANAVAAPVRERHAAAKPLVAQPDRATTGGVEVAFFEQAMEEVHSGVSHIQRAIAEGTPLHEIAILLRANSHVARWYNALVAQGINVEVVGIGGLLELPEIADVMATLKLLDDPCENPSLVRLLSGPRWRFGPADLLALSRRAHDLVREQSGDQKVVEHEDHLTQTLLEAVASADAVELVSLLEAVMDPGDADLSPEGRQRCALVAREFERLRHFAGMAPVDVITEVIRITGIDVEVSIRDARVGLSESLSALLALADEFNDLDGRVSLRSFLSYLQAMANEKQALDTAQPSPTESVKLLTIHGAKGLEYDVVIIPGMDAKTFPSIKKRDVWIRHMQAVPFSLRGDAQDFPAISTWEGNGGGEAFDEQMKELSLAEERRLGYVAVTRAKKQVFMSGSVWGLTQTTPRKPSAFLEEAREVTDVRTHVWVDQPDDKERNPWITEAASVQWPVVLDSPRDRARREVANDVRIAADMAGSTSMDLLDIPVDTYPVNVQQWVRDARLLIEEARIQHAPVREVPIPDSLSASAIVRLTHDRQGFARDLLRPMPRPPARAASRGTDFHAWVEARFGQRALINRDELLGASDDDFVVADDKLKELQDAFEAGPYADRQPYAIEAPIQIVLGGRVIVGRIDAVYQDDDGTFDLIDWKTGTKPADREQLAVYRIAWAKMHGIDPDRVKVGFYYVLDQRLDRPDVSDLTAESIEQLLTD